MPAAAAVPPRKIGGIAQNTLTTDRWPICDSVKLSTSSTMLWPKTAASTSPTAAVSAHAATCHLRSPVRSECRPIRTIAINAATNGTIVIALSAKPLAPDASRRIFGSHRKIPYVTTVLRKYTAISSQTRGAKSVREQRRVVMGHALGLLALSVATSHSRSIRRQPVACSGVSVSTRSARTPSTTAGRPFADEQPLPAAQPAPPVQGQQRFGDRCADDHRDRARPS